MDCAGLMTKRSTVRLMMFCSAVNSISEQINLLKRQSSVCQCECVCVCMCINYVNY